MVNLKPNSLKITFMMIIFEMKWRLAEFYPEMDASDILFYLIVCQLMHSIFLSGCCGTEKYLKELEMHVLIKFYGSVYWNSDACENIVVVS